LNSSAVDVVEARLVVMDVAVAVRDVVAVVELVMLMVVTDVVLVVVLVTEVAVWLVVNVRLLLLLLLLLVLVLLVITVVLVELLGSSEDEDVSGSVESSLVVMLVVVGVVVCVEDVVVPFADPKRSKVSTCAGQPCAGHFMSFSTLGTQGQRVAAARLAQQHTTTAMQHCSGLFNTARKLTHLDVLVPKCMIGLARHNQLL